VTMARAVFLDRDGSLIRARVREGKPYPPKELDQVELDPGAKLALSHLKRAGYLSILISNQPDVARGTQDRAIVQAINNYLCNVLPLVDCFVCYHDDADACTCRKPRPGLILRAAERYDIDLGKSFVVGDRWRDIDAGYAAGCRTVWIDHGYHERAAAKAPTVTVTNLKDAIAWILVQK
jgi:D-glycero-D-manno-heptose 1,7-bisphosphate phosphatase